MWCCGGIFVWCCWWNGWKCEADNDDGVDDEFGGKIVVDDWICSLQLWSPIVGHVKQDGRWRRLSAVVVPNGV